MSKVVTAVVGAIEIGVGIVTQNWALVAQGVLTEASLLLAPGMKARQAQGLTLQLGESTRNGIFGRGAVAGGLVDAFNYGGKYGTDWTMMVIDVAHHRCADLEGFYVQGKYVPFTGDGAVAGFNGQLAIFWRPGAWDDEVPPLVLANCPTYPAGHPKAGQKTWTANDRGRGVAKVFVAYKADKDTAKHPVWSNGRPSFTWVVKGALCYSARLDDTVGGNGPHRWNDPTTREWTDNPIDCRYTWARGFYAGDKVDQPSMLLLGRGLSDVEAPPANVFAPANVCDEAVPLKGVLASLNVAAHKNETVIHLNTVAGLSNGMSLAINEDGGFTETATVQSISGTDVTLTGGLEYDHPAFTAVSWATSASNPVSEKRYTIGGIFGGDDAYIDTETDIAAACGGIIVERDGSVEMMPGAAQPVVWHITDDDLIVGSSVSANDFRSITDDAWCNTVSAKYVEPSQQWKDHSAPVRRVAADIIADGKPRVDQPSLALCISGTQAQRVAEQRRRMGRLWRTRSLVLGPRFIGVEHGDWLAWTSRRFGPRPLVVGDLGIGMEEGSGNIAQEGATLLFRVDTDGQDEKWQNSLQLREVGFDVYDWNAATDELSDGAVAVQPDTPVFGSSPDAGTWTLSQAVSPARLVVTGAVDDDRATDIIFEYRLDAGDLGIGMEDGSGDLSTEGGTGDWQSAGKEPVSTTRKEITGLQPGATYEVAVSYTVAGVQGDRLVLGPVVLASNGAKPDPVTDLAVTPSTGSAAIAWRNPQTSFGKLRVFRAATADPAGAVQVGPDLSGGLGQWQQITDTVPAGHYWWWAQTFGTDGTAGDLVGPIDAVVT